MDYSAVNSKFDLECDLECEFCSHDLPTSPSPQLLALRNEIDIAAKRKATKPDQSLRYILSVVAHCMHHTAERTYELQSADHKWPSHINFASLGRRVEALCSPLLQVWQSPQDNQFFQAVTARIKKIEHMPNVQALEPLGQLKKSLAFFVSVVFHLAMSG